VQERRVSLIPLLSTGLLASMYGLAIYAPPLGKIGQVILFALLSVALWQKVQDRIPYLLEPSAAPPRRLSLLSGLVAALAFLNLQGALHSLLVTFSSLSYNLSWLIADVSAGTVVALAALSILRRVPGLLVTTGLFASRIEPRPAVGSALLRGGAAGVGAALVGIAYLVAIDRLGVFPSWKEKLVALRASDSLGLLSLGAVYLLAAPLFEEFLFRGLLYQGMRRSIRPALAVLGSAALFALAHPPVSVFPAFILGIAAAVVFARSGLLVAAIVAHLVFNAIMLAAQWAM
jgi:membrane protease YdiL (CAAX protease family)